MSMSIGTDLLLRIAEEKFNNLKDKISLLFQKPEEAEEGNVYICFRKGQDPVIMRTEINYNVLWFCAIVEDYELLPEDIEVIVAVDELLELRECKIKI